MSGPAYHGRTHAIKVNVDGTVTSVGSDPIPGLELITSGGGGGGIDFETYPQAGDWLYVETTGPATGAPSGFYDMELTGDAVHFNGTSYLEMTTDGDGFFQADGTIGIDAGTTLTLGGDTITIDIDAETNGIFDLDAKSVAINANGATGDVSIVATRDFYLASSDGNCVVRNNSTTDALQLGSTSQITLDSPGTGLGTTVVIHLTTGAKLEVVDDGDVPLMRVNEGGTYQIRTGATWQANL